MRRACAIILFLVFTQYLVETASYGELPEPRLTCGKHGDDCSVDGQCCTNLRCHKYAKKCQVKIDLPNKPQQ